MLTGDVEQLRRWRQNFNDDSTVDEDQPKFEMVWSSDDVPNSWKTGLIIRLPKNGDLRIREESQF